MLKSAIMSVFVTVGSTSFDQLIEAVCSSEVIQLLSVEKFTKIILQIGRGNVIPKENHAIEIEWFRYKDSISEEIKNASLVIGHAGAGTILECLIEKKPLITVLNEDLMQNHQSELAEQMEKEGFLISSNCTNLHDSLKKYFNSGKLRTFISEPNMFPAFLEEVMGL